MKPPKAILLDLDDTLLGNNMDTFLPGYFHKLGQYVAPIMEPEPFIDALLRATNDVVAQPDPQRSNHERFWDYFERRTGLQPAEQEPFFETFYRERFPDLASLTRPQETAVPLVDYCFQQGWQVVVATNPLFPRTAIEQRLEWAGLSVDTYDFALVTSFELMHATKPHTAYYEEILRKIGVAPAEAIMVGDSWENDIEPTYRLGMRNFWIQLDQGDPPDPEMAGKWGTLADFFRLLRAGKFG